VSVRVVPIVIVVEIDPLTGGVMDCGLKLADVPEGNPVTPDGSSVTVPPKPKTLVTVTV
jgi:hypothetical protein